ncbi:MFS transporter [Actinocorallia sp. API 0066]|uniref:MFS transporter n=1 Tax=Actinocorallia sp. API 0066 TaxID=2896846 RepID=UPI001E38B2FC|nr:MFS transporter [Actinocorallia sp. API 0066]MCD0448278.1 MFS transporter [Actinocorallia sp. API 0066]
MLFRARWGTFSTFALAGLLSGVWVVRMPALRDTFGLSAGTIGVVLLTWGLAAIIAMQGLRGLIARTGSRAVLRISTPLTAASFALLGLMPSFGTLLVAVALFGMAFGVTDVSMNAQGSVVERAARRPVLNFMHAGWCVGAMTGGLIGAATAALGLSFGAAVLTTGLAALPLALLLAGTYLPDPPVAVTAGARRGLPGVVYLIGAIAFLAFMAEGAVADWSGLLLHDDLGASQAVAALAYPAFEAAMLVGRLAGDRFRTRFGSRLLITGAGVGTFVGMLTVLLAPTVPLALAGFFLTGLMVCVIVPTTISLAGTAAPGQAAAAVTQVGAMGYGGLLLGPVVIGAIAEGTSVRTGLAVVLVLAAVIVAATRKLPLRDTIDSAAPTRPADDRELQAA